MFSSLFLFFYFFFNDTATTEIYTLSLHDALPICVASLIRPPRGACRTRQLSASSPRRRPARGEDALDRKSTRLNSSHVKISYAVFCLKKKKKTNNNNKKNKKKHPRSART